MTQDISRIIHYIFQINPHESVFQVIWCYVSDPQPESEKPNLGKEGWRWVGEAKVGLATSKKHG